MPDKMRIAKFIANSGYFSRRESEKLIRQAYKEVIAEGFELNQPKIGIMIEVPSVIFLIDNPCSPESYIFV